MRKLKSHRIWGEVSNKKVIKNQKKISTRCDELLQQLEEQNGVILNQRAVAVKISLL